MNPQVTANTVHEPELGSEGWSLQEKAFRRLLLDLVDLHYHRRWTRKCCSRMFHCAFFTPYSNRLAIFRQIFQSERE